MSTKSTKQPSWYRSGSTTTAGTRPQIGSTAPPETPAMYDSSPLEAQPRPVPTAVWGIPIAWIGTQIVWPHWTAALPASATVAVTLLTAALIILCLWRSSLLLQNTGIQWAVARGTSWDRAQGLYFTWMRPGVLVHELSHMLVAILCGGRIHDFSAGETTPQQGRSGAVRLGHVTYSLRGSSWGGRSKDALIGMAPFPCGMGVTAACIAVHGLDPRHWENGIEAHWYTLLPWTQPTWWVSLLLVLWVTNQMFPSPEDRKNWPLAGVLLGGIALLVSGVNALGWGHWGGLTTPLPAWIHMANAILLLPLALNLSLSAIFHLCTRHK